MTDFPQLFASGAIHPRTLIGMTETLEPMVSAQLVTNTAGEAVVLRSPYGRKWRVRLSNDGDRVLPIGAEDLHLGDEVVYWATARWGRTVQPSPDTAVCLFERPVVPGSLAATDVATGEAVGLHLDVSTGAVHVPPHPNAVYVSYRPVLACVVSKDPSMTSQVTGLGQGFDVELVERARFVP